jgi:hypothetical protein
MGAIDQAFIALDASGIYGALLPFLLIFTLVFAFLQKSSLFGDTSKKFNVVLALIIGLMVVVPSVTNSYPGTDPVKTMQDALPNVVLWIIAIFALWLLLAAFGIPVIFGNPTAGFQRFITVAAGIVVAVIFGHAAGWLPANWDITRWLNSIDATLMMGIFIFVLCIFVLVWIISPGSPERREEDPRGPYGPLVR